MIWKNASWLGVVPVLLNIVALFSTGYITRRVGPAGFGQFSIALALTGLTVTITDDGPGFPTDLQPMAIALASIADGTSMITENVFEARFRFVEEMIRLGADARTDGHHAVVRGLPQLSSAPVWCSDIRAGAGLVLACATGLAAWLFSHPFLTTHTAHVDWPLVGELHLPSAFIFDLGVFTVVVGTTMLMLVALAHQSLRAHRLPGEDTPHHTPHDITHADGRAT